MPVKVIDYWNGTNPVLNFTVKSINGLSSYLMLEVKQLVHCGRTARNSNQPSTHVALAPGSGVNSKPVPGPIAFLVPAVNATNAHKVQAYDNNNNAEVEPVILFDEKENVYITVGSDHADRSLESTAGAKSKLWSPKVMSNEAWYYQEIKDHWDKIVLSLWGFPEGKRQPYMNSPVQVILPLESILQIAKEKCKLSDFKNTVLFCGSVPFLTEDHMWGPAWDFEMFDPVLNRKILHHYDVEVVWK